MPWDWETFPEFLDSLDRTPKGVNILPFQGLAPLMMYVMGLDNAKNRPATGGEMTEMQRLLPSGGMGTASTCAGGPVPTCAGRHVWPQQSRPAQGLLDEPAEQRAAAGKYRCIPYLIQFCRPQQLATTATGGREHRRHVF